MSSTQHPASVSPSSRRSFSDRISAVGAKINRALSSEGRPSQPGGYNPETESITSTIVENGVSDRSRSRGRDTTYSSGRGGAGNFHSTLPSGEVQEFPWPRGRDRAPTRTTPAPASASRSTGRGGSGNFNQSPPPADPSYSLRDREILRAHAAAEAERNVVRSSGRGGMGNIVTAHSSPSVSPPAAPRSRSRSVDPTSAPSGLPLGRVPPTYSPHDRQVNGRGVHVNGNEGAYVNGNANNGGYSARW